MSDQMREEIQIVEVERNGETSIFDTDQNFTTEAQAKAWIMENSDIPGDRMSDLTLFVRTVFTSARKRK